MRGKNRGAIGSKLKEARERAGLSQDELADRALVHRLTIVKLESGARTGAALTTLTKLARVLGVSVDDLTGERSQIHESPVELALRDYLLHPWSQIDKPTKDELEALRRFPVALWNEIPPNPDIIHGFVELMRKVPPKR